MARTDDNPVTCGNCGTENPPDQEFCTNCDQPLTKSAAQGIVEQAEAQHEGGVFGVGESDAALDKANVDGVANPRNPGRGT